jgi:hypothetical protein
MPSVWEKFSWFFWHDELIESNVRRLACSVILINQQWTGEALWIDFRCNRWERTGLHVGLPATKLETKSNIEARTNHMKSWTTVHLQKPRRPPVVFSCVVFSWRCGGSSTQAWMPAYVSILRIPQMIWVRRATVEWYWQGKPKNSEKNLSHCHFSTTNPTWIDPGANPGLLGERSATNDLSHGTAFRGSYAQTRFVLFLLFQLCQR